MEKLEPPEPPSIRWRKVGAHATGLEVRDYIGIHGKWGHQCVHTAESGCEPTRAGES